MREEGLDVLVQVVLHSVYSVSFFDSCVRKVLVVQRGLSKICLLVAFIRFPVFPHFSFTLYILQRHICEIIGLIHTWNLQ